MIGIDTNVLVRQIIQDDEAQGELASYLIENHCSPANPGYLSLIVLCELVWVLGTAYGYSRKQISLVLRQVLITDCFETENHAIAWQALYDYNECNADYSDYLIARLNEQQGAKTTYTFDRKAAKAEGFTLLIKQSL